MPPKEAKPKAGATAPTPRTAKPRKSKTPEIVARLVPLAILGIYTLYRNVPSPTANLLEELWDQHLAYEFDPAQKSTSAAMATMTAEPSVLHVPTLVGGAGRAALTQFYETQFIFKNPPVETTKVKRTLSVHSQDAASLVDEMIFSTTHVSEIDWLLPGVKPTGRAIRVPLIASVDFVRTNATETWQGWRLHRERIYWDQASVLEQVGLVAKTDGALPVMGVEQADTLAPRTAFAATKSDDRPASSEEL